MEVRHQKVSTVCAFAYFSHRLLILPTLRCQNRERAPFVFTPAFASVLGGEGSPTYM
jgi:hypothetical protein